MSEDSSFLDQYGIKPELERKAMETIEWLTLVVERGAITEAQFSTGVDALFMAVSGLVKSDINDLITAADKVAKQARHVVKRCFVKDDIVVAIERELGEAKVTLKKYRAGVSFGNGQGLRATDASARDAMNSACDTLLAGGYVEL